MLCGLFFGVSSVRASEPATPKAKVSLVPFSSAIAPGQKIDVGVRFELESGWHMYWQNSGDAGAPPKIIWTLPQGLTAGELQFPAPKKHVSPGDIVTNVLKGEPVLLTSLQAASDLSATELTISAKVVTFVCAEQCIQEEASVQLKLPVSASTADVKPANEDILNRARKSLPKSSSKVVSVVPSVSSGSIGPGSKFVLDMKAGIAKGHHIQSNTPTMPSLIPAEVFMQRPEGVRFQRATFPTPKMRKDKFLGELSEFGGEISIKVPVEIDSERKPGPLTLVGVFSYQACEDNGNCLPPESLGFSLPIDIVASAQPIAPGSPDTAAPATQVAGTTPSVPPSAASIPLQQAGTTEPQGIEGQLQRFGLAGLFLGCFLYGLFINATPCVLPLLSIKVLGFVQQAHESRKKTLVLGLAFGSGVILFFIVLGLLAARGENIQQYPIAVIALGGIVLAMALSMLGVFTLHVPTSATNLDARIVREGPVASFAKGLLAPVLGFACTGPLLAGAFGWATQQPPKIAILAFVFSGLGMASPYMLLGANPNWLSFLPRPGMWMITFERIMGFLLLAMVVWLVNPLVTQIGVLGLQLTLVFYVVLAMACWLLGKIQITMPAIQRWKYRLAAVALVLGSSTLVYGWAYPLDKARDMAEAERNELIECRANGTVALNPDHIAWKPWSPDAVEKAVASGKLVFVDFTAAYCTVCKVNKHEAIDTPEVRSILNDSSVVAFQGDFSNGDDDIATMLRKFSRAGVPLNLIYPPGRFDTPILLQTNLDKEYLLKKLSEARSAAVQSASIHGR